MCYVKLVRCVWVWVRAGGCAGGLSGCCACGCGIAYNCVMLVAGSKRGPGSFDELISPGLIAALDRMDFRSAKIFAGKMQGERHSKARGRSVEFEDYRSYVPGDDLRHIDWNVLARLDKLFIKIFQEEQDLGVHVVIDASVSMDAGNPCKLVFAQRLAMALGYLGLVNNNRVQVTIFGNTSVRRLEPIRSSRNVQSLAKFLLENTFQSHAVAHVDQPPNVTFTRVLKTLAASTTGRGVMVLASDLFIPEGYRDGLAMIGRLVQGGGWDVAIVQTLSPGELDPLSETDGSGHPVAIGDLRLTDAETGRGCEVTLTRELVRAYQKRLAGYISDVHAFAAARGMSHAVISSATDVSQVMLGELRACGVVE